MAENFEGSIAQVNVQFPIESVIQPISGEQYARGLIYGPLSKASEYLPGMSDVEAGDVVELNSSNYGVLTGGLLKTWLTPFFTEAMAGIIGVVFYDDGEEATLTLATVYEATKYYAYFKFGITDATGYNALQQELAALCVVDVLYSRLWIGLNDNNVLTSTSSLVNALEGQGVRFIYNPDTNINAALAQLGATLSKVNVTGTPVGNDIDMVGFATINASGTNGENLNSVQKAALDSQKVGYNTYVGDGTEDVVTEGSLYLDGSSIGAEWIKAYVTYMCKVKTANYMARMNVYRNNSTYQGILLILQDVVKGFVQLERLANFKLTAPVFKDLPPAQGDVITVPNAWQADYIDSVRMVTVYGTLYITQPTR